MYIWITWICSPGIPNFFLKYSLHPFPSHGGFSSKIKNHRKTKPGYKYKKYINGVILPNGKSSSFLVKLPIFEGEKPFWRSIKIHLKTKIKNCFVVDEDSSNFNEKFRSFRTEQPDNHCFQHVCRASLPPLTGPFKARTRKANVF